jgi:hypothetical protein
LAPISVRRVRLMNFKIERQLASPAPASNPQISFAQEKRNR